MKKEQVRVGGKYTAKVSGQVVTVEILQENAFRKGWRAKNLSTGREIEIKTAARLREEVTA